MRRVMYLFLPGWPIDRLRRLGSVPSLPTRLKNAAPAEEAPFATIVTAGGRHLLPVHIRPAVAPVRAHVEPTPHGRQGGVGGWWWWRCCDLGASAAEVGCEGSRRQACAHSHCKKNGEPTVHGETSVFVVELRRAMRAC